MSWSMFTQMLACRVAFETRYCRSDELGSPWIHMFVETKLLSQNPNWNWRFQKFHCCGIWYINPLKTVLKFYSLKGSCPSPSVSKGKEGWEPGFAISTNKEAKLLKKTTLTSISCFTIEFVNDFVGWWHISDIFWLDFVGWWHVSDIFWLEDVWYFWTQNKVWQKVFMFSGLNQMWYILVHFPSSVLFV